MPYKLIAPWSVGMCSMYLIWKPTYGYIRLEPEKGVAVLSWFNWNILLQCNLLSREQHSFLETLFFQERSIVWHDPITITTILSFISLRVLNWIQTHVMSWNSPTPNEVHKPSSIENITRMPGSCPILQNLLNKDLSKKKLHFLKIEA